MEEEIIECERQLMAAQAASDVEELDALIDDDLLFVDMSGQMATKAMDLESHRAGTLKINDSRLVEQGVRVLSADAAVVVAKIHLVGSYAGNEFSGDFRYTRIWQRGASGWRIAAGHMGQVGGG